MVKQSRNRQPIASHPLFPAMVSLWFGALFGLGSLAVRASLLESFVISSHIDAIIPQAAPPLGITARILLAVALAAIGGVAGSRLARWIARPKPEVRERRRGARPSRNEKRAEAHRYVVAEAPAPDAAAAPDVAAVHDNVAPARPVLAGRRRSLAVEEGPATHGFYHDAAPLPGGQPQILDVTEFDFAQMEEGQMQEGTQSMASQPVELDLGAFPSQVGASSTPEPVAADGFVNSPVQPLVADGGGHEFAMPAPDSHDMPPEAEPAEILELRDNAALPAIEAGPDFDSAPVAASRPFAAPLASAPVAEQPFAMATPNAAAPAFAAPAASVRPFAVPAPDLPAAEPSPAASAIDGDAAPFETVALDNGAAPNRPFAAPALEMPAAAQPAAAPELAAVVPAIASAAEPAHPFAAPQTPDAPEHIFEAAALQPEPAQVPQAFAAPAEGSGAIEFSQPSALLPRLGGRTERLDEQSGAADELAMPLDVTPEASIEFAAPAPLTIDPEAGPAARIVSASLSELSPVELIERMALSLQRRREQKGPPESVTPPATSTAAAAPSPLRPEPFTPISFAPEPAPAASELATPQAPGEQPQGLALPAALRPIDFSDYEEDDDSAIPAPPRSMAMPPREAASAASPEPVTTPFAAAFNLPFPSEVAAEDDVHAGADVPEENYSSLLDIGRPVEQRQQFIRIEEPEPEADVVEPVVIFPGRAARAENRFDTPPDTLPGMQEDLAPAPAAEGSPSLRRFDAQPGQPGPAPAIQPRDPAETERALRSALATLQRMTGAA